MDNWLLSCSMARCVLYLHYFIYKEQIHGLEFISSVVFAFRSTLNVKSKELSLLVKQAKRWWAQQRSKTQKTMKNKCGRWQEVGVSVSTIKRLHQSEYSGFTTRCEPLVSLKNIKARSEFGKKKTKKNNI